MKVKGAQVFSVLELQNGYFQIPIKHNGRHKAAFILPWDKYQWRRLLLGLLDASFTFTETIVSIFSELPFVVVDILKIDWTTP